MRGAARRPNFFAALRIDDAQVQASLQDVQGRLAPRCATMERIDPIRFHLTLCLFCLPEENRPVHIARATEALRQAWNESFAFRVQIRELDVFSRGRVIFAGTEGTMLPWLAARIRDSVDRLCPDLRCGDSDVFHCTLFKQGREQGRGGGRGGRGRGRRDDAEEEEEADVRKLESAEDIAAFLGQNDALPIFGFQEAQCIQLLRMQHPAAPDGYYGVESTIGNTEEGFFFWECLSDISDWDIRRGVVEEAHVLEEMSYASDEAASLERMLMRAREAHDLFWTLGWRQNNGGKKKVVGFINSTCVVGTKLLEETMGRHEAQGDTVCIHSVVVEEGLRKKGLGSKMMVSYLEHLRRKKQQYRRVALLAKPEKVAWYVKLGFKDMGPSEVHHGQDTWHDLVLEL